MGETVASQDDPGRTRAWIVAPRRHFGKAVSHDALWTMSSSPLSLPAWRSRVPRFDQACGHCSQVPAWNADRIWLEQADAATGVTSPTSWTICLGHRVGAIAAADRLVGFW